MVNQFTVSAPPHRAVLYEMNIYYTSILMYIAQRMHGKRIPYYCVVSHDFLSVVAGRNIRKVGVRSDVFKRGLTNPRNLEQVTQLPQ